MNINNDVWADFEQYGKVYKNSILFPNEYWKTQLNNISWHIKPIEAYINNEWLPSAVSNLCINCLDIHDPGKTAIIWYGDQLGERCSLTYGDLLFLVKQISQLLISNNIKKGDVVCIYMPTHYVSVAAMLACARIGAVHLVVFSGFSGEVLNKRVNEAHAKLILTVTEIYRRGKIINLINTVKQNCHSLPIIILDQFENFQINSRNDTHYKDNNKVEWLNNKDNCFILYTSGTSGVHKGVVHAALPYMLYIVSTFKTIFNPSPDDIVFCTSDIGWITGHSYSVYAPLLLGLTTVLFSGAPTYPTPDRYWNIIEKEKVSIFYTAPTALRSLKTYDIEYVNKYDLSSLKVLGSVGEPLNTSTWHWYFNNIGKKRCPIINTWWQTETGGIVLAPLRNLKQIPGSTGYPFLGLQCEIKNGQLVIANDWPGKYKCIIGENHNPSGVYETGDAAEYLNENRQIQITGRVDDIINISGHRLSTTEFEKAINTISEIKEAAIVAVPHEITGETIIVFASIDKQKNKGITQEEFSNKIFAAIRQYIGSIAKPSEIIYLDSLPKTVTGKILRSKLKQLVSK